MSPAVCIPHTHKHTHGAAKCVYATITQSLILQSAGSQFRQSMFQLTYFSWEPTGPTDSDRPGDKQKFFCPAAVLLDIVAPSQLCLLWHFSHLYIFFFSLMAAQEAVRLIWTGVQWNGRRKKKELNVILLYFNLESICEEDEDNYEPVAAVTLMFVTFADG